MTTLNLDQKAAQYAQQIVLEIKSTSGEDVKKRIKTLERLVTKTLGVLQEQGLYAMMIFLFSRTGDEKTIAPKMLQQLYRVVQQLPEYQNEQSLSGFNENSKAEEVLRFYSDRVCDKLDSLLLVKDLCEQTLIYSRYGAKAEGPKAEE